MGGRGGRCPCAVRNARSTRSSPTRRAEKGLSNYLIYHTAKTDKKVAAPAANVGFYEDDAAGNLVRKD